MTRVRYCASSIAFAALPLLVAVMLASCGTSVSAKAPGQLPGQSAGKGTPASVEACDLLMSADVAALLGTPVVEPTRSRGGDEIVVTDCSYKTVADPASWA